MRNLDVIQGDTLDVTLTLENPEEIDINKVIFKCPSLKIELEMHMTMLDNDSLWGFAIAPEITQTFRVGTWDYSIWAESSAGDIYTVIFQGQLTVKHNRIKAAPIPPYVINGMGWTED